MSTGFEFDVASGDELEADTKVKNGQYHLGIADVDASQVNTPRQALKLTFEVFDGTTRDATGVCTETGKMLTQFINFPRPDMKDEGKFCKRVLSRLFVATGMAAPGQKVVINNWMDLRGRQFIGTVKRDDKGYANIDGAHFYSINDPEVSHVPVDREAVELLGGAAPPPHVAEPAVAATAPGDDL